MAPIYLKPIVSNQCEDVNIFLEPANRYKRQKMNYRLTLTALKTDKWTNTSAVPHQARLFPPV